MDGNANNQNIQQPSEKDVKKANAQQAGKDLAEVAAKGAATYFGGPVGGAIANKVVNSKLGQKTLNNIGKDLSKKRLTRNFLADSQPAISKAKPALDTAAGKLGGLKGGRKASSSTSKSSNSTDSVNKTSPNSSTDSKSGFGLKKTLLGNDNLNETAETADGSIDISKKVFDFFKKNPGVLFSIAFFFFATLIPVFIILLIASLVMYGLEFVSNIVKSGENFLLDVSEIFINTFSIFLGGGNAFQTNENAYYTNLYDQVDYYFKSNDRTINKTEITETKFKGYINAATFYSNVMDPDTLINQDSYEKNEEQDNQNNNEEEFKNNTFITNSDDLRSKYWNIKNDPKELGPQLFKCEKSGEKESCTFSEEKYKKYLEETYVPNRYINCGNCDFKDSTDSEKESAAKRMTNEIISQARSISEGYGADDESNEIANTLTSSGITVKDSEENVIGTYSMVEYVEIIVERDASEYNDEIKKAYALNIISKLLSNSSNTEITEDDFNPEITVKDSTKKTVDAVKNLKIMKNGKIYYGFFNFEEAKTVNPQEYVAILKALFGDDISIEESISDGLQQDPATGFYMRVEPPSIFPNDKSYQQYYNNLNSGYIGECAWYAANRANEITKTLYPNDSKLWWDDVSHGGGFCDLLDASKYKTCWPSKGEKCQAKQGAIISWDYGEYGHVAVIEEVSSNGTVTVSDGAITKGGYAILHDISDIYEMYDIVDEQHLISRLANCTQYGNTGCMEIRKKTQSEWENYLPGFKCYVYLTEAK